MAENTCPKCGARVSPTDVQCLDCGADLAEARRRLREELQEQSVAARTGSAQEPEMAVRVAAAAGRAVAGETSKETRLRIFDQQEAEVLRAEAAAALVLAIIALLAGAALLGLGLLRMKTMGFATVFGLRPADLRSFGGLIDPRLIAIVLAGTGLGGLLTGIGLLVRRAQAATAVANVEAGEKPEIVGLNAALEIGLLLLVVFCPVGGLVLGIILRLSKDTDIAGFGGLMIWISLAVIVLALGNILYGYLVEVASRAKPAPKAGNTLLMEGG